MKKGAFALVAILCGMIVATLQAKAAQVQQAPAAVSGLKTTKVTKKSVQLKWKQSKNASGYLVYQYNTEDEKYEKIKTTKKTTYTVKKGLEKNKVAKFVVRAYRKNGKVRKYAPYSQAVSVYVLGSKKQNVQKVNLMYSSLTVEEGATFKLDTEVIPESPVASDKVRFSSNRSRVVKVTSGGMLIAAKRGKATITATAHNGVSTKISIWVLGREYSPQIHKIRTIENIQVRAYGSDALKIKWKKCGYTDGYIVYRYYPGTKKRRVYKVVKGKTKTSAVISELDSDVNYSFVVAGYRDRKGIEVYGTSSRVVSGCAFGGIYGNVTSIRFAKSEYEVMEDEPLKLNPILSPFNPISRVITYKSSKEDVATVAADGTVTGHKVGKTYITAYSHNGLSVRVPVRVVENTKYAEKISVLCFHRVVSDTLKKSKFPDYEWVAAVSDFERQMKYLYDNHYTTLTLDEFYTWYKGKKKLPAKTVVLTFDDGDYEFYHLVYPILKKYKMKATMFIVGSRTGETTEEYRDEETSHYLGWDKIDEMKKAYPQISFQSHTHNMHYAKEQLAVYQLSLAQIYEDFEINRLSGIEKKNTYQYIAYPFGGFNDDVVYCAKKYKYKLAFDFGPGRKATRDDSIYHIPRMKINGQITMEEFLKRI